jgi:hypothetical protein
MAQKYRKTVAVTLTSMCLRVAISYPKTGRVEVKGWEVSEPNSEGIKRFTPAAPRARVSNNSTT